MVGIDVAVIATGVFVGGIGYRVGLDKSSVGNGIVPHGTQGPVVQLSMFCGVLNGEATKVLMFVGVA